MGIFEAITTIRTFMIGKHGRNDERHRSCGRSLWQSGMLWLCTALVGCAHHPRVQNPFPGVFRIAVAPLNDKSGGAGGLDTEQLTRLFASELQKVPTFEVVPVTEVQQVLGSSVVETNQPYLAFALARAVHAQAVIVGDVVEYSSYYPPRLGLHCELYAMVVGEPEVVTQTIEPELLDDRDLPPGSRPGRAVPLINRILGCEHGRRPERCEACGRRRRRARSDQHADENSSNRIRAVSLQAYTPSEIPPGGVRSADGINESTTPDMERDARRERLPATEADLRAGRVSAHQIAVRTLETPEPVVEPWVVRHTRIFDGTNAGLVTKLRGYHFFTVDARGGDWQGYLQRSEDFQRFACNRMIFEMLDAAGGRWTALRGLKIPKPWEPWPWR
jgi:hypothetical protein